MYARLAVVLAIGVFATATAVAAQSNRPAMPGPQTSLKALNASFDTLSALENASCPRVIITGRVSVSGSIDSGGGFESLFINVWDDGTHITALPFSVKVGFRGTYDFSIAYAGTILTGATGVGVYVENGAGPAATSTFTANGSLTGSPTTACPPVSNSITLVSEQNLFPPIPTLVPIALAFLMSMVVALGIFIRRRR